MTIEDDRARYIRAAHAMQSGVAMELNEGTMFSTDAATPKHLRVGVNSAMSDTGSLARLLVAKGVITEEEYVAAVADGMELEVAAYEERLNARAREQGSTTEIRLA